MEKNYSKNDTELKLTLQSTRLTVSRCDNGTDQWDTNEFDSKEEHMLVLQDQNFKNLMLERLNTFRLNRELCDVVLFVKEHEIHAHKVVLASISNALFDMFQKETEISSASNGQIQASNNDAAYMNKNHQQGLNYFEFAQGDFYCFDAIVNFAYTSKLEISNWRVADLYKTAYCLQIYSIANACALYLAENLSISNCIGIRRQANFNNDEFLVNKVDSFITENIEKIIHESVEFTKLPCVKLRIITENNYAELDGLNLAEKCLQYFQQCQKRSDRIDQQIELLVEKLHLLFLNNDSQPLQNLCDADDTSSVGSCDIVQDYKRGNQASKKAAHNNNIIGAQHRVTGAKTVRMNACLMNNALFASNESLNSISSSASTADDEIESGIIAVFNNSPSFWIAIAVLFRRIVVFSIQLSDDQDVTRSIAKNGGDVISKHDSLNDLSSNVQSNETLTQNYLTKLTEMHSNSNNQHFDSIMINDLNQNLSLHSNISNSSNSDVINYRRIQLPTMMRARCSMGATFVNGQIIIFGGYDRGECLKSVEEFDVSIEEKWYLLPEMLDARGRFDSAVESGKVYAIAGSNGNNDLKSCEMYDPKQKQWTKIKSLNKARSHNGCTTVDGLIYCIGGSSDQVVLRDCERYNPKTNEWESIASLQTPRFQAGCTSWRGLVICLAGCDRWNCLDTVEAYDPKTDTWRYLARLKTPRRGCAVAVIRDALYVIGGHDGTQSLTSVEVLDYPNAHNWRLGPSLNVPRANTKAVVTARNAIYVIGGFDGSQFLDKTLGWRSWYQQIDQSTILEEEETKLCENELPILKNGL